MAKKKKVKILIKFRDSHRNFVRKTIAEAKDLTSGGNPIELQVLDRDIVERLEAVSKLDSDVSESCELISVIQECMVDLESALTAQESQYKNHQSNSLNFTETPSSGIPFGNLSSQQFIRTQTCLEWINYLKSLLTGIAQSVVTGLALTSANYEKAVELLKRRFVNRQVVMSSHIEALTKIPKVASTSEVKRL
ncbi:hypothetical protein P5673_031841 [Acropora cervicornis]|uniref:Uncharacterized protein n=1 Tax=Acropora cervicornis TaxID=6130 RepID=A0AAD9PS20_ACRCE|nr:hypothetical protein P5673_031841 [Acropora cervicornis]